jgi:hypothetical protein
MTNISTPFSELPEKRTIEIQDGVKIEVRFEHSDWLSNSVNIVVGVIDPGVYENCFARITTVTPNVSMLLVVVKSRVVVCQYRQRRYQTDVI